MTISTTIETISRRTALTGLAAGGLGLALATTCVGASAQAAATDLANHPLAGTWLAMANPPLPEDPQIAVPSYYGADGSVLLMFPLSALGPQGVVFGAAGVGTWEADGEQRGHFTAVRVMSDANGTFTGTTTIDGYPEVSQDGQTFIDDGSKAIITIRDPAGAIVQQFPGAGARPVTAMRMGPSIPGFPEATPEAGTPTP
jgi:hypothetical protein